LARHVTDVDIYHTDRDKAAYNGGLFWFTDHYLDAATSTHRTYSRHNAPSNGVPYGGGPGSEHAFATGLLTYYYLSGDPDAWEAVLSLADWIVNMDDGSLNLLGLIDDAPTGLASHCGGPDFHGPGRGAANSINVLLDAWLLTQQDRYLHKAEELVRRCIHPHDDIERLDLLNAEKRWSYTMFLSALARYLDVRAENEAGLDGEYAYARASLLHYAQWMLAHERPYLDHPERLEYVTEAWAAQELRKANVLQLAARHAERPLAEAMRARAVEISDRAWSDLYRFDTRTVARCVALMMTEGAADAFFRAAPWVPAPAGPPPRVLGNRPPFVPQKARVRAQLRSVRGVARGVLRLAFSLARLRRPSDPARPRGEQGQ
jgi:hypothetical protein